MSNIAKLLDSNEAPIFFYSDMHIYIMAHAGCHGAVSYELERAPCELAHIHRTDSGISISFDQIVPIKTRFPIDNIKSLTGSRKNC